MGNMRFTISFSWEEIVELRRSLAASHRFVKQRLSRCDNNGERRSLLRKFQRIESLCKKAGVPDSVLNTPIHQFVASAELKGQS